MIGRLNLLLLAALLGSCLLLVRSAYESRRLFAALDQARLEQGRLAAEFKRLDAERQSQGTHLRVERTARERLKMSNAAPGVTFYAVDAAVSGSASGAQP